MLTEISKRERTLLLVDDEENILSSLTRLLRRDGYKIFRAAGGKEGLKVLAEQDIGVIITDQRMPEMTGVEFLYEVKQIYPDTVRIVLSGYTELKSVTDAINEGAIYKFLTKPWDDELLQKNIAEAFERYEMKMENIRLADELKSVNESLEKANKILSQNVEKKTEEASLNLHVLTIAQEVLENMPAGIIGIDDSGVIAITNKLTEQWLANGSDLLIGSMAKETLPGNVFEIYENVSKKSDEQFGSVTLKNEVQLDVYGKKMGISSSSGGTILVLTQTI